MHRAAWWKRAPAGVVLRATRLSPLRSWPAMIVFCAVAWAASPMQSGAAGGREATPNFQGLRQAIHDLTTTFGERYPGGSNYLQRLEAVERAWQQGDRSAFNRFRTLQREALLANPLLDLEGLLVVKRRWPPPQAQRAGARWYPTSRNALMALGLPSNHECNSALDRLGYDNEIALLRPIGPTGRWQTVYRPPDGGYVGEIDLHWDGQRLLFTRADATNWKLWEIRLDGSGLRQVSHMPDDVDCFDGCYLPDGGIVFGSTASFQSVPCWHGQRRVSSLYRMRADGSGVRQLCFDQDHDFHPVVLPNGQVMYHRWDYTGINHIYLRELMVMNPDGTGQRAVYGASSWFPNALYFPRPLPGDPARVICILSGYHGVHRMGQLVLVDWQRGWYGADGLVQRISGKGDPIQPKIRDQLVNEDWPKFLHPFPLSDKYFLVAAWPRPAAPWGIYLADVFDNLVLLREEPGYALLEPTPVRSTPSPPVIPERIQPGADSAIVYLHDVYAGPGLRGVPRGTVKRLRVLAYDFGYPGLAGPNKIGLSGPWEVMRILGTVPIQPDGSALFRVPANTPLAVQPLDEQGQAVQLMRSWFTAMPGEFVSCSGCHERPADAPEMKMSLAARSHPQEIKPWHGPARGFDFAREVQPVLDRYCVSCHHGDADGAKPDLRGEEHVLGYRGHRLGKQAFERLHPRMREITQGYIKYTPAYEALLPYIRRVGIEDDVSMLVPGEYHASTSELVQLLRKGHAGVRLDAEAWDRLITWIDLNAPCHGTWGEVFPIPDGVHERRMALRRLCCGPEQDPEQVPELPGYDRTPVLPSPLPKPQPLELPGWPWSREEASRRQAEGEGPLRLTIDLGDGLSLELVRIPAGEFVMGDVHGMPDEYPQTRVQVPRPFWMATHEISNEQFRRFDPAHDSRYYVKRHARQDDPGLPLNQPRQPVVRVSWHEAMAFCQWLSARTGGQFTLPTEAQWEYACRAGTATALAYGGMDTDFGAFENLADISFSHGLLDGKQITGGLEHLFLEGADLSNRRYNDGAVVTIQVGRYRPNVWGLHDMHGNAAEWTRTSYRPYPYRENDGRNDLDPNEPKVVRGGSFFDRPARARSSVRYAYEPWQKVFNVGFRVICEAPPPSDFQAVMNSAKGLQATPQP